MLHDRKEMFLIPIFLGLGRFRFFMMFTNSSRVLVKRGLNLRSSPTVDAVWPDAQRRTEPNMSSVATVVLKVYQMLNLTDQSKEI